MRKYNAKLTPLIRGTEGDVLDGGAGDDRLYADIQITVEQAIANGNSHANINAQGDWLAGGNDLMRWRTRAATTNSRAAANDETSHAWRVAA